MSRSRFAIAAILYALVVAYASTALGVAGQHFIPLDPWDALGRLIQMPYVEHGSDQRSDWMGNLLLLVPLGFLLTGWLSPRQRPTAAAAIGGFALCLLFILTVKYAQLFFPPRTVTLNYVVAQSLGAAAGILLFRIVREPLARIGHGMSLLESLRLVLRIYTALVILFLLMPLDFALSPDDIATQFDKLPDSFTAITGEGRPLVVRLAVIFGGMLAMAPIGAMLTIVGRDRVYVGRSAGEASWLGLCAMAGVYALSTMLISGNPSLFAVFYRTAGIALGAWAMRGLTRWDPEQIRLELGQLVPWAAAVYLLLLLAVNGLLSTAWLSPEDAVNNYPDGWFVPLYNYYIVTKSQAAKDFIAHAIMYAPVGVMVWPRAKHDGGKAAAFFLAALLSATIEAGRFLRPGLVADINAIPLAGASAWVTLVVMRLLWRMLEAVAAAGPATSPLPLAEGTATPLATGWRDRAADRRSRRRDQGAAIGDIEDY